MNVEEYLRSRRELVESALEQCFPPGRHQPETLYRAVRYALLGGGKRVRPLLLLAATECVGGRAEVALPFACAVEMIHTYALVHDDLPAMDDDALRRGKPTVHVEFGEGIAILVGDALLTEAFRLMTDPETVREAGLRRALEAAHTIAEAAGMHGMVGGQVADLEAERKEVDLPTVEMIHVRKTGALIRAAVRVGAMLGGARASERRALERFAEAFGLAFQVADDVLDAVGKPELTGKRQGGDQRRRKATYAALLGVAGARDRALELRDQALRALVRLGRRAEPLRAIARQVIGRIEFSR